MSKRKLSIVMLVCVLAGLTFWFSHGSREDESDEAKYQNWSRNQAVSWRLRAWERRLPKPLASLVRRTGLAKRYELKAEEQEETLFRSGYLVKVSIAATNVNRTNMSVIGDRLWKALPKDACGTYFWLETNRIVITCRTQDVVICKQALRDF